MTKDVNPVASHGTAAPPVGEALAALVAARCRMIAQGLSRKNDRHAGVHRARKAIRSLRAILALAGDALGEEAAPIDRALQRLARGLSTLRDAHVAVATAQSLVTHEDEHLWLKVAARLQARNERLLAEALASDPGFSARRARVARLADALAALPWQKVRRKALYSALAQSERRVARAERKTQERLTASRLHRWRRRLRRLRMQVDALRRVEVGHASLRVRQGKQVRALKARTDRLGQRQDLEVLKRLLPQVCSAAERVALRARLRQEIADLDCMD